MLVVANHSSLKIVIDPLEESIKSAQLQLEHFVDDTSDYGALVRSKELITELRGIFKTLAMPAPRALMEELVELYETVEAKHSDGQTFQRCF
jgi:hypothetical protein